MNFLLAALWTLKTWTKRSQGLPCLPLCLSWIFSRSWVTSPRNKDTVHSERWLGSYMVLFCRLLGNTEVISLTFRSKITKRKLTEKRRNPSCCSQLMATSSPGRNAASSSVCGFSSIVSSPLRASKKCNVDRSTCEAVNGKQWHVYLFLIVH